MRKADITVKYNETTTQLKRNNYTVRYPQYQFVEMVECREWGISV